MSPTWKFYLTCMKSYMFFFFPLWTHVWNLSLFLKLANPLHEKYASLSVIRYTSLLKQYSICYTWKRGEWVLKLVVTLFSPTFFFTWLGWYSQSTTGAEIRQITHCPKVRLALQVSCFWVRFGYGLTHDNISYFDNEQQLMSAVVDVECGCLYSSLKSAFWFALVIKWLDVVNCSIDLQRSTSVNFSRFLTRYFFFPTTIG